MLDPTTLITRYFLRRVTANSPASAKHMNTYSRQFIPAVTHPRMRHFVLTLTMCVAGVKMPKYPGYIDHCRLPAMAGTRSDENEVTPDSTLPAESSR